MSERTREELLLEITRIKKESREFRKEMMIQNNIGMVITSTLVRVLFFFLFRLEEKNSEIEILKMVNKNNVEFIKKNIPNNEYNLIQSQCKINPISNF